MYVGTGLNSLAVSGGSMYSKFLGCVPYARVPEASAQRESG
jgi:hypothetical protein